MKKIGIVTICDYLNYGNRLQNYAVQEVLASLGCEAETIVNTPVPPERGGVGFAGKRIRNALSLSPVELLRRGRKKIGNALARKRHTEAAQRKEAAFREFSARYIRETDFVVKGGRAPEGLSGRYDFFVVGSDQVWNPAYRNGSAFDFLQFAPKGRRIAYSPSFGVEGIPEQYAERYASWLSEMDALSVREPAGANIIKQLTGRKAEVLADPTLMLTREQWLAVSRPAPDKPAGKYLLTYFIGDVSREREEWIVRVADNAGLEIVRLGSLKDWKRFHSAPDEFVDYVHSAGMLCTDSFHGIIFSLHMETPFVVFNREGKGLNISSRIDNLLTKTGFQTRQFHQIKDGGGLFDVDFSHMPGILRQEREKTLAYLKKALQISNSE